MMGMDKKKKKMPVDEKKKMPMMAPSMPKFNTITEAIAGKKKVGVMKKKKGFPY